MNTSTSFNWSDIYHIRSVLHMYPELSFQEFNTTKLINEALSAWGIPFQPFKTVMTGGFAEVGKGKTILFRSDIDALPVQESDEHKIKSVHTGIMHACGHDFHTAIGLGLLKYFKTHPDTLPGKLRVIFQPGEESAPGGAEQVVNEEIWDNVFAVLAIHADPSAIPGVFILSEGAVQASSTSVYIRMSGPGGHTSKVFESVDLISAASNYIIQLQGFLRERADPREPLAFAFGSIHGGQSHNILPQTVELKGTIRTYNNDLTRQLQKSIIHFSERFSGIYDIQIAPEFPTSCPATLNDFTLAHKFRQFMTDTNRIERLIISSKPSLGADDFSFYLNRAPGLYLIAGGAGYGTLHSGNLELNETLIDHSLDCLINFIPTLYE